MERQLANYRSGFPYLDVLGPAVPGRGILVLDEAGCAEALAARDAFEGSITKFVPASGAASRMFKDLFEARDVLREALRSGTEAELKPAVVRLLDGLEHFPFYDPDRFPEDRNTSEGRLAVLERILTEDGGRGLAYGSKPKGQILFHRYDGTTAAPGQPDPVPAGVRTALEEHLVEAARYACGPDGTADLHVTVSPEHLADFEALVERVRPVYEARFGCRYRVSFSVQDPETDIVAADENNEPFRKADGSLLFRPGGHGALLQNLNRIDSEVVIIKNIDNVVREELLEETVRWKRILTGLLVRCREETFGYLRRLNRGEGGPAFLAEIRRFLAERYGVELPDLVPEVLSDVLRAKLDRPIRVCGMVRNEGEPGGGPFRVRDADGCTSLQILETAQLDLSDPRVREMQAASTHFNPVDLVCSLRRYDGSRFDLPRFVDPLTGFISEKSYEGRRLKAQELPGLWNGSMSQWNTVFVEVPLITFNPVKTVFDLLRPEHCGAQRPE